MISFVWIIILVLYVLYNFYILHVICIVDIVRVVIISMIWLMICIISQFVLFVLCMWMQQKGGEKGEKNFTMRINPRGAEGGERRRTSLFSFYIPIPFYSLFMFNFFVYLLKHVRCVVFISNPTWVNMSKVDLFN